jgi:membrane-bound metal-dependent hydrolase YbcI (DUF457 family)
MPLPVAHGLLGATVVAAVRPSRPFNRNWRELVLGALLGICPDFDYFLNLIPGLGGGWHHGFTHSFGFAFLLGFLVSLGSGKLRFKDVSIYSLAIVSHPLLDFVFTESKGIELFWPFSTQRFRLQLPNPINYGLRDESVWTALWDLLKISLIELMIFAPLLLIVLWITKVSRRRLRLSGNNDYYESVDSDPN